jgi:Ser/Thr protein kinase RdoA (MazF antagonist)
MIIEEVLKVYGFNSSHCQVMAFGNGLINYTWKITTATAQYVLQKVNTAVFKNPAAIAANVELLYEYAKKYSSGYLFVAPVKTTEGYNHFVSKQGEWYRLFPFVPGSHTVDTVASPQQAFEAARQFGLFTKTFAAFPLASLQTTIPDFHNLSLRYQQFEKALLQGNTKKITQADTAIRQLKAFSFIVSDYTKLLKEQTLRQRVTHHDTKISNVLFNTHNKGLCVIDLDTVMPGYFISDVGDMIRTYVCPVSEEETAFEKIIIRHEYVQAIKEGYAGEMGNGLTKQEQGLFLFAGKYMIYMQALRFLTDYINDDVYYGARYPEHNFMRAQNQITLLQQLINYQEK